MNCFDVFIIVLVIVMDARSAKAGVHVIFCQCFYLFIYFFMAALFSDPG